MHVQKNIIETKTPVPNKKKLLATTMVPSSTAVKMKPNQNKIKINDQIGRVSKRMSLNEKLNNNFYK